MQIAILGPLGPLGTLSVRDGGGRTVEIAGSRLRTLLVRLALDAGRPVPVAALVDAVWGDRPPADEANALQTLVSRLRRALGDAGAVLASPTGYRLAVEPDDVDAVRFEHGALEGSAALRRGDRAVGRALLGAALELWRTDSLADALADCGDAVLARATRLDELRLTVAVELADTDPAPDPAALEALAAAHPLDERLAGVLMRALAAAGRQADALRVFERVRARLADELGADPSGELQQVHLAVLRDELAPAAPTPSRRTNLKAPLTSFVGREAEVARIAKSLEHHRLVTLVGPGGAGKTRLATESARSIQDRAPDGVWLVELAPVTAGADVAQAVLTSVGLRETHLSDRPTAVAARDAVSQLREGLAERHALLVLDNCEHVIEASATLAEQLLGECPDLRILATSREPLGILGETLLAVPALGQPAAGAEAADALEYPAVRLFADRAAAVAPDFAVTDATVAPVTEIVRRLDGLPLAIELAAARLRTAPIDEIAARLSDRFRLLTGGSRTALPRHRTLRAVVEWSWDLLTTDERRTAEQLAVFPAGITTTAAIAVRPGGVAAEDVTDLIASLVDKSLLQPVDDGRRVRMLETIREYGAERLADRGELGAARERHAAHFADLLAEAAPHLTTRDQLPWFATLEAERENIVAAVRQRCDAGDADGACRMAVQLAWSQMMLGHNSEVPRLMAEALAVPGGTDPALRLVARALLAMNAAGSGTGDAHTADAVGELRTLAREFDDVVPDDQPVLALVRPAVAFFAEDRERLTRFAAESLAGADPWGRAATLMLQANLAENDGEIAGMRELAERAMVQFRQLGERWGLASTLRSLGAVALLEGRLDDATAAYEESLELIDELHSEDDKLFAYGRLADIALRRGDVAGARRYAELAQESAERGGGMEALFIAAMIGDIERRVGRAVESRALHDEGLRRLAQMPAEHPLLGHIRAYLLVLSGRLAMDDGDLDAARRAHREAFSAALGTKDSPILANTGVLAAELEAAHGRPGPAAELLGAAARLRGADELTAVDVAALADSLRATLGDERFTAAYDRGRALTREQATARLTPAPD